MKDNLCIIRIPKNFDIAKFVEKAFVNLLDFMPENKIPKNKIREIVMEVVNNTITEYDSEDARGFIIDSLIEEKDVLISVENIKRTSKCSILNHTKLSQENNLSGE